MHRLTKGFIGTCELQLTQLPVSVVSDHFSNARHSSSGGHAAGISADLVACAAVGVLDADPEPAGPSPTSEVDTLVSWRHSSGWLVRGSPAQAPHDHRGVW